MTVVILSVGLVAVHESMLVSVNALSYYTNYLTVQSWMANRAWEAQDSLMRTEGRSAGPSSGILMSGRKEIEWKMSVKTIVEDSLYEVTLRCSWRRGGRDINVSRVTYADI